MDRPVPGAEIALNEHDIIVSKTDPKGRLTYVNDTFRRISKFNEAELMNQPHNIIRHPDMPRCVFKLLWEKLEAGEEVFAYVKNICKNQDYYWVFAHVTPSFSEAGEIIGYHSNRRVPDRNSRDIIESLYRFLWEIEESYANKKEGMRAAYETFSNIMKEHGATYDQFIFQFASFFNKSTVEDLLEGYRPEDQNIKHAVNG